VVASWPSSGIAGLGTTSRLWYPNTGAGFSASASVWTLDGESTVELVFTTYDGSGIADLGTTRWLIYAATCE
jgi:hypothetical protein